ncbi:calpain-9-like isoform X1 [Mytilus galloprovincialis]|uniref:calpain-9-like isoform X1 n=1 Tax=Mytilus galloprovincialis TaxID=29158 RepID=UPI003F7BDD1D
MNFFKSATRTVRTTTDDGSGPRTETKTYSFGDDGPSIGYGGGGNIDIGFGKQFGGGKKSFNISNFIGGGGGSDGGSGGGRRTCIRQPSQRPQVGGRASRKEKKNPFSGLNNQSYDNIKKMCLEEGILFEDPEFPAQDDSIFFSRAPNRPFVWKRPADLVDSPEFIASGVSRFDVKQGELGDCWLLAAIASLTCNEVLLNKVVPPEQNFTDEYCGLFKFNIWHEGDWTEVVVDDRLPSYMDSLVFMHSADKHEFWSALLEKAYAKLHGSYESLKGGSTSEAMEDFTGGVTEMFDLKKAPKDLLTIMLKAHDRGSLMGCSIDADPNQLEAELANGLIMGHAYSVTAVKMVEIQTPGRSGKLPMVRCRNPWGNESEWKGAFSDESERWKYITDSDKEEIGLTQEDDGEFWMTFGDWQSNFQKLEICNLGPDSLDDDELVKIGKKRWEATSEVGEWIPNVNAGGCRNYLQTFFTNPQYRVTVTDPDEDEDDLCTILVGVLQKDRRKKRKEGLDMLTIGYVIYKLKDPDCGPLDVDFFKYNASVAKSPSFINLREVCGRHMLQPGTYCIIPSTFEPHNKGEYLLRIFTEKANVTHEIDEETAIQEDQDVKCYNVILPGTKQMLPQGALSSHPHGGIGGGMQRTHMPSAASAPPPQEQYRPSQRRTEEKPPTEEEVEQEDALKRSFKRVSGDDMEIDAFELRDILNAVFKKEFDFDGFGVDACRSMVAMHDGDLSGKLGFDEFKTLWTDLRKWKGVFKEFDKDSSGRLSSYELRSALHASGFKLSNRTFSTLVMRFSNKAGEIEFSDFMLCAIKLKTMLASFKSYDAQRQGIAAFDVDSFVATTMYS